MQGRALVVLLRQAVSAGNVKRETGIILRSPPSAQPASPAWPVGPEAAMRQQLRQPNFTGETRAAGLMSSRLASLRRCAPAVGPPGAALNEWAGCHACGLITPSL